MAGDATGEIEKLHILARRQSEFFQIKNRRRLVQTSPTHAELFTS